MRFLNWLKKNSVLSTFLLASLVLYFYNLPQSFHFAADQGRDAIVMRNMLTGKVIKLTGPTTSVGAYYLGPFFYYFTAPSLLLANFNPIGPAIMQALLGSLTVFCLFKYLEKYLNKETAIIATGWYLILPSFIFYNRFAWNPNPIPLFFILFSWLLTKFNEKQKLTYLALATLSFWILLQLHLVTIVLGLPLLISLINFWKNDKKLKNIFLPFLFLVLSTTATMPLLIGILKKINENNTEESLFKFSFFFKNILNIFLTTIRTLSNQNLFLILIITTLIFTTLFELTKIKKLPLTLSLVIIPSLIANLVGQSLLNAKLETHYIFVLLTCSIVVLSYYFTLFLKNKKNILNNLSTIFLITAVIIFYPSWQTIFQKKETSASSIKEKTEIILKQSNNEAFQIASLLEDNNDDPFKYFLNLETNNLKTNNETADQIFIICSTNKPCQPSGNPHWEIAKFEQIHLATELEKINIESDIIQIKIK